MRWIDHRAPTSEDGWYAVLICYDPREGILPDAMLWNGEWSRARPNVISHAGPFATEKEAKDWAYENDPDI